MIITTCDKKLLKVHRNEAGQPREDNTWIYPVISSSAALNWLKGTRTQETCFEFLASVCWWFVWLFVSRCSYFKLDLLVLFYDGFRSNSLFLSMYTVDRDYHQFFNGKSSLIRNLILVNFLYSQDSRVIQSHGLLTRFMGFFIFILIVFKC